MFDVGVRKVRVVPERIESHRTTCKSIQLGKERIHEAWRAHVELLQIEIDAFENRFRRREDVDHTA